MARSELAAEHAEFAEP